MYKYPYTDDPEPIEIETAEDRFLRKFKNTIKIISYVLAAVLMICFIYSFIIHR